MLSQLDALVNGKTVALVGNSSNADTFAGGPPIDDHDVVIRINLGLPTALPHATWLGRRTTIWATAKFFHTARWLEVPKLGVFMKLTQMGDEHWRIFQARKPTFPMIRWPRELEDECERFVGASPSTGIRMLWYLKTKASPSHVSTYGFDNWATPTNWSGKMNTVSHEPKKEADAMRRLLVL